MKKIIISFVLTLFISLNTLAQEQDRSTSSETLISKAQPQHGIENFKLEFAKLLSLSDEKISEINQDKIKVLISFQVDETGKVSNVKVLNDKHNITSEISKTFNLLSDWIPAKNNGENISSYNSLPLVLNLRLSEKEIQENEIERRRQQEIGHRAFFHEFNSYMVYPKDFWERYYYKKGAYDTGENNTSNKFQYIIEFVINEEGKFEDIETFVNGEKDLHLNKSVKRALSKCNPWEPAIANGKKVKTKMSLPITININK